MSANTKIEWADHTFNPWEGCTKIGPGCDHCYAEARNHRFGGNNWGPGAPRRITSEANWATPLKWNRDAEAKGIRYRVFCASLADWLDNEAPVEWLIDLLDLIRQTPNLDWLLLTKRIGNIGRRLSEASDYVAATLGYSGDLELFINDWVDSKYAPDNVWVGATIVNQQEAERDIPKLFNVPAARRFLSMEPLLGPVNLTELPYRLNGFTDDVVKSLNALTGNITVHDPVFGRGGWMPGIDWVIAGGESGPGARPMHPDWVRTIRDQCKAACVPFLFKQWGEWCPRGPASLGYPSVEGVPRIRLTDEGDNGSVLGAAGGSDCWMNRAGKAKAGRLLDGRIWDQLPEGLSHD